MSMTLKNIVVGFIHRHDKEAFLRDWRRPLNIDIHFLTSHEAYRLVDPDNNNGSIGKGLLRSVQKHIGGGPSEFLRDVRQMPHDELLLAFEFYPKGDNETIPALKAFFKNHRVRQAKYFGQFAVEHLTLDVNHEHEMPAIHA